MADALFRTSSTESTSSVPEPDLPSGSKPSSGTIVDSIEVPYRDYASTHNHPYTVDHFQLGSTWNDPVGGFPQEIQLLEDYVMDKIDSGEVANSISAIKNLIKDMEKVNNLAHEERPIVKIGTLANYVEFLMKQDKLKYKLRKYANP